MLLISCYICMTWYIFFVHHWTLNLNMIRQKGPCSKDNYCLLFSTVDGMWYDRVLYYTDRSSLPAVVKKGYWLCLYRLCAPNWNVCHGQCYSWCQKSVFQTLCSRWGWCGKEFDFISLFLFYLLSSCLLMINWLIKPLIDWFILSIYSFWHLFPFGRVLQGYGHSRRASISPSPNNSSLLV